MKKIKFLHDETVWQLKENFRGHPIVTIIGLLFLVGIFVVKNVVEISAGSSSLETNKVFWDWWAIAYLGFWVMSYEYSNYYKLLPLSTKELKQLIFGTRIYQNMIYAIFITIALLPSFFYFHNYSRLLLCVGIAFYPLWESSGTANIGFWSYEDENGKKHVWLSLPIRILLLGILGAVIVFYEASSERVLEKIISLVILYIIDLFFIYRLWRQIDDCPVEHLIKGESNK